jgi:nicotinate-nucleotide pyrophosphorylase (carboxylating)
VAERAFLVIDPDLRFRPTVMDGDSVEKGKELAYIEGKARSILKAERVALNFLSHMSGIATKTKSMVDAVQGTKVKIYDTRKTMPLHRYIQKYAVRVGGGTNHRWGLWDMVLIKDNHLRAYEMQMRSWNSEQVMKNIIRQARSSVQKNVRIEVEVENLKECEYALAEKPDVIMLDNMNPAMVRKAVEIRKKMGLEGRVLFEVSGGITPDNIGEYASSGMDIISSGALTASVKSIDFSLEIILKK